MASLQDCEVLKQALNTRDPLIKVTGLPWLQSTNFLDLIIYKETDFEHTHKLDLDLYQKHQINFYSFLHHPNMHTISHKGGSQVIYAEYELIVLENQTTKNAGTSSGNN